LTIGKRSVPNPFSHQLLDAVLIDINVDLHQRISSLAAEYGGLDKDFLAACTERIRKRLGPQQTKHAITAIMENRIQDFIRIVLVYYDKTYRTGLAKRNPNQIFSLDITGVDIATHAAQLLTFTHTIPVIEQAQN
ncbi:MAG: tRNA 2-selenouridine(34) synthase MnmH, partial [Rhodoferax sp.]|nr:tRNA 2-selenouridine(34) synthase MnmH [Rhodoferax sp.]